MEFTAKSEYIPLISCENIQLVKYINIFAKSSEFISMDILSNPSSPFNETEYLSSPSRISIFPGLFSYVIYPANINKVKLGYIILGYSDLRIQSFGYYIDNSASSVCSPSSEKYYGISNGELLSDLRFSFHDIPYINEVKWASVSDSKNLCNHCGPVSATNVIKYLLTSSGKTENLYCDGLIYDLYRKMSTGKLGTLPSKYVSAIKSYFFEKFPLINLSADRHFLFGWDKIRTLIDHDMILSAYTWSKTFIHGAHYLNIVGWREYDRSNRFLRVLNQWDNSCVHFIRYGISLRIHISALFSFHKI